MLELRFGLTDGYSRTLEEVGKQFKVTRERIRQQPRLSAKCVTPRACANCRASDGEGIDSFGIGELA